MYSRLLTCITPYARNKKLAPISRSIEGMEVMKIEVHDFCDIAYLLD
jgi:hypothetical protein